ncbi:MAG TPA: AAA family ATPase [Candidatus Saccharimonadales bacterium]|nr:AAA family ATPase [Candidatus Saccharimonadales bacterium]
MNAIPQETAKQAAQRLARAAINGDFTAEALHTYRDADGNPAFWRWRARKDGGEKVIRPMYWNGSTYIAGEPSAPATGKLLYLLPEVLAADPATPVLIVEGEWCADHLHKLGVIATTSGSASSASGADWTPLERRHCVLWPDHDEPGSKYANDVIAKLHALGCTVERIDVTTLGLPDKGDCVDWLATHPGATSGNVLKLARVIERVDNAPPAASVAPRVMLTRGSDVQPEAVDWLWDGWLAAGKLHLIGGAPGTGKTTLATSLAAIITSGSTWPDGTRATCGSVVIWSGEDDVADTLNPRLRAAGADMTRVHMVSGVQEDGVRYPFDPACNMDALRAALATIHDVRLIVLDPIVSAVSGDSHKNAEVRRGLQPVVDMAHQLGAALLGVTHFSKGTSGRDPVERITGSLAFAALARLVMVTAKQEAEGEREERRLLLRAKSNIGPDGGGFAYELRQGELCGFPGVLASSVRWGDAIHGTARDLLAEAEQRDADASEARDAVDWLRDLLTGGPVPTKDVKRHGDNAGFAWRTLQRAMQKVGVVSQRGGFGLPATWALPAIRATSAPVAPFTPHKKVGATGATDEVGVTDGEERESFTL